MNRVKVVQSWSVQKGGNPRRGRCQNKTKIECVSTKMPRVNTAAKKYSNRIGTRCRVTRVSVKYKYYNLLLRKESHEVGLGLVTE